MAYSNQYQNSNRFSRNNTKSFDNRNAQQKPRSITPEEIPENYVDVAENVMEKDFRNITTSKLRNLMSLLVDAFNVESRRTEETITTQSQAVLLQMRVRLAYEYGRGNNNFKNFLENSKLQEYLKGIGSNRQKFIDLYHYVEALVSYHKYYGGREN